MSEEPKEATTEIDLQQARDAAEKKSNRPKTWWNKHFPGLCNMHNRWFGLDYARCITPEHIDELSQRERLNQALQADSIKLRAVDDTATVLPPRTGSPDMPNRLTVIAKKGGVGKSTLSMAMAGHFATNGKRVLVVDLDAQATSSQNCLTKRTAMELPGDRTIAALFDPECDPSPEDIVHASHLENIWVLPANDHFSEHLHPKPLSVSPSQQIAVSEFLDEVEEHFDWIIIDSPPALANLAGWNCLTAAQFVISPVQMEGYSAQTVVGVEEAIAQALTYGNPSLRFLGYVISEFDKTRKADHAQAEEALRARYGQQVFDTVVYRRAKLPQSQNADQHIYLYAPKSPESRMIDELAIELESRIEKSIASNRRAA